MAITTLNKVKTVLGITTTEKDDYIEAIIPLVEEDYLHIRNKEFDIDWDGKIVYPTGSEMTAIRMVAYLLSSKENDNIGENVQSETISRYSVTYSDKSSKFGYPSNIVGMIKRYMRFY